MTRHSLFGIFYLVLLTAMLSWCQSPDKRLPGSIAKEREYILGPGDQVAIYVTDSEELKDRVFRISSSGEITLPMVGTLPASGLTANGLEDLLRERLRTYSKNQEVGVGVKEYHSHPVSVLGAVKNPGVQQIDGQKTVADVLALAGGLTEDAGRVAKITRQVDCGNAPLPGAVRDESGRFVVAEISLKEILTAGAPDKIFAVCPNDAITVPRAELVYVVGEVAKPGGFPLNDRGAISVLQAVALAGGLGNMAAPKNSRILRNASQGQNRTQIAINLSKILEGKAPDPVLQPDDMLFVPNNTSKRAAIRAAEAAIQTVSGVVIWRGAHF